MKLAEALMLRSDYQVKVGKIEDRILNNVKIQEGENVTEEPDVLFKQLDETLNNLQDIITRINVTNNITMLDDETTISAALTKRDIIAKKRNVLECTVHSASIQQNRISRSEIKFISTVDVPALQKEIDRLSKEHRMLDAKIQEKNWLIDLI